MTCLGSIFCPTLSWVLRGRNVQGFVVEGERVLYKTTWRDRGRQVRFCPFCGLPIGGAKRVEERVVRTG